MQINKFGESHVYANPANKICLKLFPKLPSVSDVKAYEVPVRLRDLDALISNEWDLTIRQVVPHIDNVAYVKRIAARSGVDISLVKNCLRQLLYYQCIAMIDIFQYSNVYTPMESIGELYRDKTLQEACVQYVSNVKSSANTLPSWKTLFRLYSSFQRGLRLSEFCKKHSLSTLNIDVRKLITFGVLNKLIRRVHKYPVGKEGLVDIRLPTVPLIALPAVRSLSQNPNFTSIAPHALHRDLSSPQNSPRKSSTTTSRRGSIKTSPKVTFGEEPERRGGGILRSMTDFAVAKQQLNENKMKKTMEEMDEEEDNNNDLSTLGRMMDNTHSFDEICCELGIPHGFLERQVRADERCVIISR